MLNSARVIRVTLGEVCRRSGGCLQHAAAVKADRRLAAFGVTALLCLLLAGCAADSETPPTVPATVATSAAPPEPELAAPEPETPTSPIPKPVRKTHKAHRSVHGGVHAVAKAAWPPPSFHCHIVRESDLEGAAGRPSETDPPKVDLYARVDPQAHTLAVERASDPAFTQTAQHCGDGKPSLAALKTQYRKRGRRSHR